MISSRPASKRSMPTAFAHGKHIEHPHLPKSLCPDTHPQSVLAASGFLEEVLPFTDLIPSATIGWLLENSADRTARELKGGFEDLVNTKRRPGQDK